MKEKKNILILMFLIIVAVLFLGQYINYRSTVSNAVDIGLLSENPIDYQELDDEYAVIYGLPNCNYQKRVFLEANIDKIDNALFVEHLSSMQKNIDVIFSCAKARAYSVTASYGSSRSMTSAIRHRLASGFTLSPPQIDMLLGFIEKNERAFALQGKEALTLWVTFYFYKIADSQQPRNDGNFNATYLMDLQIPYRPFWVYRAREKIIKEAQPLYILYYDLIHAGSWDYPSLKDIAKKNAYLGRIYGCVYLTRESLADLSSMKKELQRQKLMVGRRKSIGQGRIPA